MVRAIRDFWISPTFQDYDLVNILFYSFVLCCGALTGSLVSVVVIGSVVYCSLHLMTGRLRWALPAPVRIVFFAFCGLFAAEAIAALINPSAIALNEVVENLPLLGLAGLYSVTFVDRSRLLNAVEMSAMAAPIVALNILLLFFSEGSRPALAAGNANVLALLAAILYVFNIGSAFRRKSRMSLASLAGAFAAACIVILTGTRAMWPVLLLTPFLGLLIFGSRRNILAGFLAVCLTVTLIAGLGLLMSSSINARIAALEADVAAISEGDRSRSIGMRIQIYEAGYALFMEKPIFGYGPGNERSEIGAKTTEHGPKAVAFSHAHNAILNVALRSGLLGVVALLAVLFTPLFVALKAKKDDVGWAGLYVLTSLLLVYLLSGTVGLALGHDIHDTVYITGISYGLYLVFGRIPPPAGDSRR